MPGRLPRKSTPIFASLRFVSRDLTRVRFLPEELEGALAHALEATTLTCPALGARCWHLVIRSLSDLQNRMPELGVF